MKTNSVSMKYATYISKLHTLSLLKVKSRHNDMYHHVNQVNMYILGYMFILIAWEIFLNKLYNNDTNNFTLSYINTS
jgi:hypothetical protein